MGKIIVLQGLPGSGKTHKAKQIILEDTTFVRINRDDLRAMIYNYKYPNQEDLIKDMERNCALSALNHGYNIIIDGINFSQSTIDKWKEIAKHWEYEFEVKYIFCPLSKCIERDAKRPHPVGKSVIEGIYKQYINIKHK